LVQGLAQDAVDLVSRNPKIQRPERDVFADRRAEQLIVRILKQESDSAANLPEIGLDRSDFSERLNAARARP